MRKLIYILSFMNLISCGHSTSEKIDTNQSKKTPTNTIENNIFRDDSLNSKMQEDTAIVTEIDDSYSEENRRKSLSRSFEKARLYSLKDTIKADFNGDGFMDWALYVKENQTSGIVIVHGGLKEEVRIGFDEQFAHMIEFNWVDYWGLVMDKETSEITFSEDGDVLGSQDVKLPNPSIVLIKDEVGGGLITYRNGEYIWIHQTC